jgi:hypothetical protein
MSGVCGAESVTILSTTQSSLLHPAISSGKKGHARDHRIILDYDRIQKGSTAASQKQAPLGLSLEGHLSRVAQDQDLLDHRAVGLDRMVSLSEKT